jgi:hypothetical protein
MQPNRPLALAISALVAIALDGTPVRGGQSQPSTSTPHSGHAGQTPSPAMTGAGAHGHGVPVPAVTFAELKRTAAQLDAARAATEKYQDVRVAEAAGYRAVGPNVPGMGLHYVRQADRPSFSITEPPILLYQRDPAGQGGLRLVGVSYLLVAPSNSDGQPAGSPFPKALASWHKHNNVCVLPDNSASVELTASQCTARGGRFTAETSWMVHAWIWKDSPDGVFSPTNPLVK